MDFECSTMDNFYATEEAVSNHARAGRGRQKRDENTQFKSKNLEAERRRRRKLNERLMSLRSVMNKPTILDDAITYIEGLQDEVNGLSGKLQEIEAMPHEASMRSMDDTKVTVKCEIEADVQVNALDGNKLWIKINCEHKKGVFTSLMEAFGSLGFEVTETNLTTSKGIILISFSVEAGTNVDGLLVEEMRAYLMEVITA